MPRRFLPSEDFTLSLDESGDHGFPRPTRKKRGSPRPAEDYPPPLVVGGPIFHTGLESRLDPEFNREVERILGQKGTLHRSSLARRKGKLIHIPRGTTDEVSSQICELIEARDFKYLAAACDKIRHRQRYGETPVNDFLPKNLYMMMFIFVVERFVAFLEGIDARGRIHIESRGKREDAGVAKVYADLLTQGTEYYEAWRFRDRLPPALSWFSKDHRKAGLQIADWVNWCIGRKMEGVAAVEEEFARLTERFWRGSEPGNPGQVGFKTWPDRRGRVWLGCPLSPREP